MEEGIRKSLREQAKGWTCNHFTIANLEGDTVALLRLVADSIEQLGAIEIADITYRSHPDVSQNEITMSVYFSLSE